MAHRSVLVLLLPLTVAADPLGSSLDRRGGRIDPFHGAWVCVDCKTWDENGKEKSEPDGGLVLKFVRHRIVVAAKEDAAGDEHSFRVVNPKNHLEGKLDIVENGAANPVRVCYRFAGDRFFLCMMEDDETVRPPLCGPGKKHRLYEFTPYQPKRLVQSHPLPPAPAQPR
jgi:hypothetical protein